MKGNTVILKSDVEYEPHETAGWVPKHWMITTTHPHGDGTPFQFTKAEATEVAINSPVPSSTFNIAFPVGTCVVDEQRNEWYIVTDSGKRVIAPNERGKSYQHLLTTPERSASPTFKSQIVWWFGACAVLCGLLLAWRSLSRFHRRATE